MEAIAEATTHHRLENPLDSSLGVLFELLTVENESRDDVEGEVKTKRKACPHKEIINRRIKASHRVYGRIRP
jgi:hypothetical protein